MKKYKITFLISTFFISILSYWVLEPITLNPFVKKQVPLVESRFQKGVATNNLTTPLSLKMDSIVNNAILLNDFISVSAGISQNEKDTYLAAAGYCSKRSAKRANINTLYRTASVAKPMTAVAVLQLWEKNLVDLDVPIQRYLPEFPVQPEDEITIRQLLNHTSGIKHYASMWDGISFTNYKNMVDALDEFKNRSLSFSPGTSYEYSTYGYSILGAIIEKVSGEKFQDYMINNVFLPAGMVHTDIEEASRNYNNKANLYIKLGDTYIKSPKTDLSVKYPGGGFHTTAEDLVAFGNAILHNVLIDSTTLNTMISNTSSLKEGTPYGFGWFVINDDDKGLILQHGGSQSGTSSYLQILLQHDVVTAVLTNCFSADEGVYWMARDLTNQLVENPTSNRTINYFTAQSNEVLSSYVGAYQREEDIFKITKKGNQLYCTTKYYDALPIFPKSESEFFFRHFDGGITFQSSDNGVEKLYSIYKGKSEEFIKI